MFGLILAALGSLLPNGAAFVLFICPSGFDVLMCLFALQYFSTWRELITPDMSGNLETVLSYGRVLKFEKGKQGEAVLMLSFLKVTCLFSAVVVGALVGHIEADRLSYLGPLFAPILIFLLIKQSDNPIKSGFWLLGAGALVFFMIKGINVTSAIPVLYMVLLSQPVEEPTVVVDGIQEIVVAKHRFVDYALLGSLVALLPGMSASACLTALKEKNQITATLINSFGEGFAVGIILASRFTRKTAASKLLSNWEFIPEPHHIILGMFAFGAGILLQDRYVVWLKRALDYKHSWQLSQAVTLSLAVYFASTNAWSLLFPGSGLLVGLAVVGLLKLVSLPVPQEVRMLLVTIPVAVM